jgi:hypothetical protein
MGVIWESERAPRRTVYVDTYGAVGNGVTSDVAAINAAAIAAGTNGTVIFTPGKTYAIDAATTNLSAQGITAQKWVGYGATIKRMNEVKALVTASVANGATTIEVADTSSFRVGSQVNVTDSSTILHDTTGNRTIVSKTATVLTLDAGMSLTGTLTVAAGHYVHTSHNMLYPRCLNFTVEGLEVNGNRSNNTAHPYNEIHMDVYVDKSYGTVRDCYVHDSVCEGIVIGGSYPKVINNRITNIGGNGVHLTGPTCYHGIVTGNQVSFTNLTTREGLAVGHDDGGIVMSNNIIDTTISNNVLDNVGLYAFGSIDGLFNDGISYTGNVIRNCANIINIRLFGAVTTLTVSSGLTVTGSGTTITVAASGLIANLGGPIAGEAVELRNSTQNKEYNGVFEIYTVPDANTLTLKFRGSYEANPSSTPPGTFWIRSKLNSPQRISFTGNSCIDSGSISVQNAGAFGASIGPTAVSISGNTFANCSGYLYGAHNVTLSGNRWYYTERATAAVSLIRIRDCTSIKVNDDCNGGDTCVYVHGTNTRDVFITGAFRNGYNGCIKLDANLAGLQGIVVAGAKIKIDNLSSDNNYTTAYGITASAGSIINGNAIDMEYGTAGTSYAIICPASGTGVRGAYVTNNVITGVANISLIRIPTGGRNNIVRDNIYPTALSVDAGDAANNADATDALNTIPAALT